MSEIPKHILINNREIQSLIKAEWSVIRTNQNPVKIEWGRINRIKKFPEECCGILFYKNHAYASNGHWILKIRTDGPSIDPSVRCFFYDYLREDVIENYNPFTEYTGVDISEIIELVQEWKTYNIKIRVEDIRNVIEENIRNVRNRREMAFHAGYDSETNELGIRLEHKKGRTQLTRIPVYSDLTEGFPEFSVNLSYLHKIIDIVSPWYHVIELCFNGIGFEEAIIIKAKNPYQKKPDIRFALGQYIL